MRETETRSHLVINIISVALLIHAKSNQRSRFIPLCQETSECVQARALSLLLNIWALFIHLADVSARNEGEENLYFRAALGYGKWREVPTSGLHLVSGSGGKMRKLS